MDWYPSGTGDLTSAGTQTPGPVDTLYRSLNFKGEPTFEATAPLGIGVFDTLKAVAKQVLMELRKK